MKKGFLLILFICLFGLPAFPQEGFLPLFINPQGVKISGSLPLQKVKLVDPSSSLSPPDKQPYSEESSAVPS